MAPRAQERAVCTNYRLCLLMARRGAEHEVDEPAKRLVHDALQHYCAAMHRSSRANSPWRSRRLGGWLSYPNRIVWIRTLFTFSIGVRWRRKGFGSERCFRLLDRCSLAKKGFGSEPCFRLLDRRSLAKKRVWIRTLFSPSRSASPSRKTPLFRGIWVSGRGARCAARSPRR